MKKHEFEGKNIFEVSDCEVTFESLTEREYFPQEHSEEILSSNAILLPVENYSKVNYPVFFENTNEFYNYLKENEKDDIKTSICIRDEDYRELELHNDEITLATIIILHIALPTVVGIISTYLYDLMKKRRRKIDMKIDLIVEKNKKSKRIKYQGSVEGFEKSMKALPEDFWSKK